MSDEFEAFPPTLAKVIQLAAQAEGIGLEPVYGPQQPTLLGRVVRRAVRAIGEYSPLKSKGASHIDAPNPPENRQLSFGEIMTLRI